MNWLYLLYDIIPILVEAVATIVIPLIFCLIRSKIKNETALKLVAQAEQLALAEVSTIEQTMVIPMKNNGTWNQKVASETFEICKHQLISNLNEATIEAIKTVYVDLDAWCKTQIESNVLMLHE